MAQAIYRGATSSTTENIQLDAGALFIGDITEMTDEERAAAVLGATSGGGTITIGHVVHNINADGVPENTKGFYRKDADTAQADFTMLEITDTAVKLAILGATSDDSTGSTVIQSIRDIYDTDYNTISWAGTTSDGGALVAVFYNAISTDGFALTVKDKSEGTFGLKLKANYTLDNINDGCPYKLARVPKGANIGVAS